VRYIDGRPAIISDDYFDERIVRGTELAQPEDTTRENILAEAGYEQVHDIDEIITRMPTPEEVARLGIASRTPVAEHIRTGSTAEDRGSQGDGVGRSGRRADPSVHGSDVGSTIAGRI
jgi:GntR family transcriptional regulator